MATYLDIFSREEVLLLDWVHNRDEGLQTSLRNCNAYLDAELVRLRRDVFPEQPPPSMASWADFDTDNPVLWDKVGG